MRVSDRRTGRRDPCDPLELAGRWRRGEVVSPTAPHPTGRPSPLMPRRLREGLGQLALSLAVSAPTLTATTTRQCTPSSSVCAPTESGMLKAARFDGGRDRKRRRQHGGWPIRRRPHDQADLSPAGQGDGDGGLACQAHGSHADLAAGRCLNAEGRARFPQRSDKHPTKRSYSTDRGPVLPAVLRPKLDGAGRAKPRAVRCTGTRAPGPEVIET